MSWFTRLINPFSRDRVEHVKEFLHIGGREFNRNEAQKNRDFQFMMSNTAHQREVADLKAAGINPMLTAMGGGGATTASGAAASASTQGGDMDELFRMSGASAKAQLDLTKAQTDSASFDPAAKSAATANTNQDTEKLEEQTATAKAEKEVAEMQRDLLKARFPIDQQTAKIEAERDKNTATVDKYAKPISHGMAPLVDAVNAYGTAKGIHLQGLPTTTETFGGKGEHYRTTIRRRGN